MTQPNAEDLQRQVVSLEAHVHEAETLIGNLRGRTVMLNIEIRSLQARNASLEQARADAASQIESLTEMCNDLRLELAERPDTTTPNQED